MATEPAPFEIRFDYLPASPLANGWKIAYGAAPEFSKANKPKWLLTRSHGQGETFAMDYSVPLQAAEAYRVVFDAEFREDAIFYVEVEMFHASVVENWWFAFVRGNQNGPPSNVSAKEIKFPIVPKDGKARFDFDLRQCAAQALPSKTFNRIKRVRVRGDFNLSPVLLLHHDLTVEKRSKLPLPEKIALATALIAMAAILIAPFNEDVRQYAKEKYHHWFRAGKPPGQAHETAPQTPTQTPPSVGSVSKTNSLVAEPGASPAELRQRHHVRRLSEFESGKTTEEIPADSFGYASPVALQFKRRHPIELYTSGEPLEVHKLHDGSLMVLGYVGTETYLRLQEGAQNGEKISFYSGPFKAFSHLMSIPVSRIECDRFRSVAAVRVLDCKIAGE
jgi:hypothetical protein